MKRTPGGQSVLQVTMSASADEQRRVNRFFENEAHRWREFYSESDGWAPLFQHRQALALQWIDGLKLASEAPVLEVGSGAGFLSLNMAKRGCSVVAVDSVARMVEMTRQHAVEAGLAGRVRTQLADAQSLEFADGEFDLVAALGVIEWVPEPARAVAEMARVLRSGGWMIVSSGNRAALTYLLEPLKNPWLQPFKRLSIELLSRLGVREKVASTKLTSRASVDRLISAVGLAKVDWHTVGFGPLTVLRHPLLPEAIGQRVHRRLQRFADRGIPILRSAGMEYLVLARKG